MGVCVADDGVLCRRSAFLAPPATQIGHRGQKVSQVRLFLQTCDVLSCHLRRSCLPPATLPCGYIMPITERSRYRKWAMMPAQRPATVWAPMALEMALR